MIKKRKIRRSKVEKVVKFYLPTDLKNKIDELHLTKNYTEKSYKFVNILITKSMREFDNDFFGAINISSTFLNKVFGGGYINFLNPLLESGLVERSGYAYKGGACYKYAVANFEYGGYTKASYVNKLVKNDDFYIDEYVEDVKKLNLDFDKLLECAKIKAESFGLKDIKVNEEITDAVVKLVKPTKHMYVSIESALRFAKEDGVDLVLDGKSAYLVNKDTYVEFKRVNLKLRYELSILNLKSGNYISRRNSTNNRLDTNLTNMPSFLLEIIKNSNDLVEVDMSNAQMTFLAHAIEVDNNVLKRFKGLCEKGELYNHIREKLGLKDVKIAKQISFEVLFSSDKNYSLEVNRFYSLFPSLKEKVNSMKKELGNSGFAIMLQKMESEMFIDGFYKTLKGMNLFCLTKHDSLIVRKSDLQEVLDACCNILLALNFECSLRY